MLGFENNATVPLAVNDVYVTGTVQGVGYVGGLIGRTYRSTFSDSYSSANITASGADVGDLVGAAANATTITNCDTTDKVTAFGYAGGLIGYLGNSLSTVQNINLSYATGDITVSSGSYAGGLVGYGYANPANITNSFATGNVTSSGGYTGGLVGYVQNVNVSNSYATGNVAATSDGASDIGGLIGGLRIGTITHSYAKGNVTGNRNQPERWRVGRHGHEQY